MADEETPRPKYDDPEKFKLLKGGAVYGRKVGRIVAHTAPTSGEFQIDAERSKQFNQRRREIGIQRQMRALARSMGIEVPDDIGPEELEKLAGDGLEEIILHMLRTFKDSKNLRGMAESFGKIATGYLDDRRTIGEIDLPQPDGVTILIAQFIGKLYGDREVVDVQFLDDPEGG